MLPGATVLLAATAPRTADIARLAAVAVVAEALAVAGAGEADTTAEAVGRMVVAVPAAVAAAMAAEAVGKFEQGTGDEAHGPEKSGPWRIEVIFAAQSR